MINEYGANVFLDLKYHDIPNTVEKAVCAANDLDVFMCNVHAIGGKEMMKKASAFAHSKQSMAKPYSPCEGSRMFVIGVTVLTSMDKQSMEEVGITCSVEDQVIRLAKLAKESGLSGVVASGLEASKIREICGEDFVIVTPGVRPEWSAKNDQKRILTPKQAIMNGADYIVVGRPITQAKNKKEAAEKILLEIKD